MRRVHIAVVEVGNVRVAVAVRGPAGQLAVESSTSAVEAERQQAVYLSESYSVMFPRVARPRGDQVWRTGQTC